MPPERVFSIQAMAYSGHLTGPTKPVRCKRFGRAQPWGMKRPQIPQLQPLRYCPYNDQFTDSGDNTRIESHDKIRP